jgi:hypothetical protein
MKLKIGIAPEQAEAVLHRPFDADGVAAGRDHAGLDRLGSAGAGTGTNQKGREDGGQNRMRAEAHGKSGTNAGF